MRMVGDRAFGIAEVLGGQQTGAEESRLDNSQLDAERLRLKRQGERQPFDCKLAGAVSGSMLEGGSSRRGTDVDDVYRYRQ
jgi:hypothetical protein